MELPQPRPFGAQGTRARPARDFLSLYSPTLQQDSKLSSPGYLKTQDFLQPLEREGKTIADEEITAVEKSPLPEPPLEHILPGGIGTYTVGHVSYFNQRVSNQESKNFTEAQIRRIERKDDNSNSNSFAGSGFTIWENTALKKGKTGKENVAETPTVRLNVGQWVPERPSVSSSNNHRNSFSSRSSSQSSGQKNHSFMEMIRYAKNSSQDYEMEDDDEFILKREPSSIDKGDLRVQVVGTGTDHKANNTPRSKHSATEQRRRSKINDRFLMLREIIPHSDQKRDKASFLLEVIEYIRFLQEKVHKYEGSNQGRSSARANFIPLKIYQGPSGNFADQSRGLNCGPGGTALISAAKFDQKSTVSPTIPGNEQNPAESDMSAGTRHEPISHHPGMANKGVPFPVSLQSNTYIPVRSCGAVPPVPHLALSDADNMASHQIDETRLCATESTAANVNKKDPDLTIRGGQISISSLYSQRLLNTLTQALQKSGVDLSQASISVKIELGKHADCRSTSETTIAKEIVPSGIQETMHSIGDDDTGPVIKRLKTG